MAPLQQQFDNEDEANAAFDGAAGFGVVDPNKPLGVSKEFTIQRGVETGIIPRGSPEFRSGRGTVVETVEPTFFEGDVEGIFNLPPDAMAVLQRELVDAGLMSEKSVNWGFPDNTTVSAYRQLLSIANRQGIADEQQVLQMLKASELATAEQEKVAKLPIQLDDPKVLKATFREAIINTTGEGWDDKRLDNMVAAYHDAQRRHQNEVMEARVVSAAGGDPGEIIAPPGAEAFAVTEAERQDPTAVKTNRGLEFLNLLEQSL